MIPSPGCELDERVAAVLLEHEKRLHIFLEKWMVRNEQMVLQMRGDLDKCKLFTAPAEMEMPRNPYPREKGQPGFGSAYGLCGEFSVLSERTAEEENTCTARRLQPVGLDCGPPLQVPYSTVVCIDNDALAEDALEVCIGTNAAEPHQENPEATEGRPSLLPMPSDDLSPQNKRSISKETSESDQTPASKGQHGPSKFVTGRIDAADSDMPRRTISWQPVMQQTVELLPPSWRAGYEMAVGVLIFVNALWIGFQTQYQSQAREEDLADFFEAGAVFFCIVFLGDLIFRFVSDRLVHGSMQKACHIFFRGQDYKWNIFDSLVVSSMLVEQVLTFAQPDSSSVLRQVSMLRLVRLLRLFRVLRVARVFAEFREFRVLILSITRGLRALTWILLFSLFLVYLVGVGMTQGASETCRAEPEKPVCDHFGNVFLSMMSLFQAMFGGVPWANLQLTLGELHAIYSLLFFVFIVFAIVVLVNIVSAIFIEIQIEAAVSERETLLQDAIKGKEHFVDTMINIFREIDMNHSGCLSRDELELAIEDRRMDALLSALKLDVHDVQSLFTLLDQDGSDAVSIEEFITGCLKMRGEAKAIDMAMLKMQNEVVLRRVQALNQRFEPGRSPATSAPVAEPHSGSKVMSPNPRDSVLSNSNSTRFMQSVLDNSNPMQTASVKNKTRRGSFEPRRNISRVEMRAMTLQELRDIRECIKENCQYEDWVDLNSGAALTAETLNLYQFNHYHICPSTVPNGVTLEVTEARGFIQGCKVCQTDLNDRIIAEGMVKENTHGRSLNVLVTKGKFQVTTADGDFHLWVSSIDFNLGESIDAGIVAGMSINGEDVSYKEFVSTTATKPDWFCSHWWGEPVFDFVACCEGHAQLRKLDVTNSNYWVCAYANRQHDLGMDISANPEDSSFSKAMRMAQGVLLILDGDATPFDRIWCDFEIYRTLTDNKMLDIVTIVPSADGQRKVPQLLSERPLPNETPWIKSQREQSFPIKLLIEGICVKLECGKASVSSDKESILNHMMQDVIRKRGTIIMSEEDALEIALRQANTALNAYFAQAAWPRAVKQGIVRDFDKAGLDLSDVLRKDDGRRVLSLSLGHMVEVDDREVKSLAEGLPEFLVDLDLSFETCRNVTDAGLISLCHRLPRGLTQLHLDFLGCEQLTDRSLQELGNHLPEGLLNLRLDFAKCSQLSTGGVEALAQCLPAKLQKCSATFKGTKCDRNFGSLKDLRYLGNKSSRNSGAL